MTRPVTPLLAVDAFVVRGDALLLVRRGRPPFEGSWVLPGGLVEVGETTEAAVLRELAEETALHGRVRGLVGVYSDPKRDPRGHTVSAVYAVDAPEGEPRGGDDAAEARFFPIRELPPLAFDHPKIVRDALAFAATRPGYSTY
ncbi:MAG: NUDIX domain-containing protein [Methanobacteriota archaeon]